MRWNLWVCDLVSRCCLEFLRTSTDETKGDSFCSCYCSTRWSRTRSKRQNAPGCTTAQDRKAQANDPQSSQAEVFLDSSAFATSCFDINNSRNSLRSASSQCSTFFDRLLRSFQRYHFARPPRHQSTTSSLSALDLQLRHTRFLYNVTTTVIQFHFDSRASP